MNCCLNCEIQEIIEDATCLYEDEYGSKIPLCTSCYQGVMEEHSVSSLLAEDE